MVFKDFQDQQCNGKTKESHALMTHASYGDLIHPISLEKSTLVNVGEANRVSCFVRFINFTYCTY